VTSTGLGKALVLDLDEGAWCELFRSERQSRRLDISQQEWLERMRGYARTGYAFDLEENEEQIRCIAAPIRDVAGRTVAAISISSAAQYMSVNRMHRLSKDVVETARRISQDLGWIGRQPAAHPARATPHARSRDRRSILKPD
jgi:DNA-binding IclR family transcriptional regulator